MSPVPKYYSNKISDTDTIIATPEVISAVLASPSNPYFPFTDALLCPNSDVEGQFFAEPIVQFTPGLAFLVNVSEKTIEITSVAPTGHSNLYDMAGGAYIQEMFYIGFDIDFHTIYSELSTCTLIEIATKYRPYQVWCAEERRLDGETKKLLKDILNTERMDDIELVRRSKELCARVYGNRNWDLQQIAEKLVRFSGTFYLKEIFKSAPDLLQIGWFQACLIKEMKERLDA